MQVPGEDTKLPALISVKGITFTLILPYAILAETLEFKSEKGTKKKSWKDARVVLIDAGVFIFYKGEKPDYHFLFEELFEGDLAFFDPDEDRNYYLFTIDIGNRYCSFKTTSRTVFEAWKVRLKAKLASTLEHNSIFTPPPAGRPVSTDIKSLLAAKQQSSPVIKEKTSHNQDKGASSSSSKAHRSPFRVGHRIASDAAAVDHLSLSKQIEEMAEKDLWFEIKTKILEYLAQKDSMSDTALLLRRCERPCYMLKVDWPNVDPRVDPRIYSRIEALAKELDARAQKELATDERLAGMLKSFVSFYQSELTKMKEMGYKLARIPPTTLTIVAANAKRCIIPPTTLHEMNNGTLQTTGHNPVRYFKGMYWKENPELPGVEHAVDWLYKSIMAQGSPPSVLVKRVTYDPVTLEPQTKLYQTSRGVEGQSLNNMELENLNWVSQIDRSNFCFMYIMALLTLPQDGKGDNIIVTKVDDEYHLTSIDNDHSFADPICSYTERTPKKEVKHCVNVKSILFCFPQAKEKFSKSVRKAILDLCPELIAVSWLEDLQRQNLLYDTLLQQNAFMKEEYEMSKLPIRLRTGTAQRLCDTLKCIQRLLLPSEDITPDAIFSQLYPTCHAYYQHIEQLYLKQKASIPYLFADGIFTGNSFESYPDLLEKEVRYDMIGEGKEPESDTSTPAPPTDIATSAIGSTTVKLSQILPFYKSRGDDYETNRTKLPYEELEALLQKVDFSRLKEKNELDLISRLCSTNMSFMHFTLIGSKLFNMSHLRSVVEHSRSLTFLELHHCSGITVEQVVEVASVARIKTKIIITGANINVNASKSTLDEEASLALEVAAPTRDVIVQTERLRRTQRSPYSYMSLISEALECIRSGHYMEAKTKIESAERVQSKVLAIFRNEILAVLTKDVLRNLIASPCLDFIGLLLDRHLLDVNQKNSEGLSPWHMAIRTGNLALCKLLLSKSKSLEIDAPTLSDQRTALHLATLLAHMPIIDWLLGLKDPKTPNINARDFWSHTPLSLALVTRYATTKVQQEVVERLLKSKPDLSLQYEKEDGNSALHLALHYELPEIARMLLSAGAPTHLLNASKQSILHIAVIRNMCIEAILDKKLGVNPNLKNAHGKTPLMLAALNNDISALESMLSSSAVNANAQDESEQTALRMAVEHGNLSAIRLLVEKGKADPNLPDIVGVSPMWRAASVIYKIAVVPKEAKILPVPSMLELPAFAEETSPASSPSKATPPGHSKPRSKTIHTSTSRHLDDSAGSDKPKDKDSDSRTNALVTPTRERPPNNTNMSPYPPPPSSASLTVTGNTSETQKQAHNASSLPADSPLASDSVIATHGRPSAQSGLRRKGALPPPSLRPQMGGKLPHSDDHSPSTPSAAKSTPGLQHDTPSSSASNSFTTPTSTPTGFTATPTTPLRALRFASSGKSKKKSLRHGALGAPPSSPVGSIGRVTIEKQPWLACAEYLLERKGDLTTINSEGQSYLSYLAKRIQLTRHKLGCGPREIRFLIDHNIPLGIVNSEGRNILHLLSDMDWLACDLYAASGEAATVAFFSYCANMILDALSDSEKIQMLFQEDKSGNIPLNLGFHYGARLLPQYTTSGGIPDYVASLSKAEYEQKHPLFAALMAPTTQPLELLIQTHPALLTNSVLKQLKKKAPKAFHTALEQAKPE